ncbi:unnamed protein product [Haemonchus placei]|uniref:Uncharacterized protein n=1 Tax=Haemonchus placei TaxID=6290 RepID=A0A0N4WJF6_HAEPC|nr:unnamed protein product [Haemonchus placei]
MFSFELENHVWAATAAPSRASTLGGRQARSAERHNIANNEAPEIGRSAFPEQKQNSRDEHGVRNTT